MAGGGYRNPFNRGERRRLRSYGDGKMREMGNHEFQRWREQAREHGMPEPDIDRWLGLARPELTLYKAQGGTTAADTPIVGYRGGHPSLPPYVEWPGDADFLASIDCAALPSDLPGFPLPKDGHLLFFLDANDAYYDGGGGDSQVLYIPAGTATAERAITSSKLNEAIRHGEDSERFPLRCWPDWDLPRRECYDEFSPGDFLMPDSGMPGFYFLSENREDLRPTYARDNEAMVLGGYCRFFEGNPCGGAAHFDPGHKKWRLLASMSRHVYDVPFTVHWVIREDDLAEQNFGQVQTHSRNEYA
jgi:hypothetical protein